MKLFKLIVYYLRYKVTSKKSHCIHSDFVINLITHVCNNKNEYKDYSVIEAVRKLNKESDEIIRINESGAGSNYFSTQSRKVKGIIKISAVNKKFGQLLYKLVKYYRPDTVIELGTSLGISTMYLAAGNPSAKVYTIESNANIADRAKKNFNDADAKNIIQLQGLFKDILPLLMKELEGDFLAFIDGHHDEVATLSYFNILLQKADENSIFVFDDINWSDGMRTAWKKIISNHQVTLSIDLFYMGIIFFKKGIPKQNFIINF